MNAINVAQEVIDIEVNGLLYMKDRIGNEFELAVSKIQETTGRVIICGMGKSGIIGKKIAASFASTGTPSFFMHPGEAFHGDLGMVKPEDIFVAISNSGETDEVLKLLPFLKDNQNYIIAITGKRESTLAKNAHCHLDIAVPKEACPHQLAPTASTTATLVMGDALTVALMDARGFSPESFARFHPGGSLGRRLLSKVRDEMHSTLPIIEPNAAFTNVITAITEGALGLVLLKMPESWEIITDGDVRRAMESKGKDVFDLKASDISSKQPAVVSANANIQLAFELMEQKRITSLLVEDEGMLVGILKK
ncbi:KpsF/GutQ family sugar-phosphate isomerase [Vibrio sp. 665]|uniref:KpsF/GutQ family sugar-phosphate isomerase n=1 Tax=Vibrio TaxID=662 RepID=UPI001BD4B0AB|nr:MULTISPECIES: KpsF/GutQ family sugar-phosphate isomerase [Vibrio]MBS9877634.1 KpsF/GutQ family sugar-phosphate isomerase [Vibrio alginolyticus]MDW2032844.1 KpsF/GutQ family sugar-phosphate isomerase [Vibrio sp. 665]